MPDRTVECPVYRFEPDLDDPVNDATVKLLEKLNKPTIRCPLESRTRRDHVGELAYRLMSATSPNVFGPLHHAAVSAGEAVVLIRAGIIRRLRESYYLTGRVKRELAESGAMLDSILEREFRKSGDLWRFEPIPFRFKSPRGRAFTVDEEPEQSDEHLTYFRIRLEGAHAGKLYDSDHYGPGLPWSATTRELYWAKTGGRLERAGFDVAAFRTARDALAAWARSADQILDFREREKAEARRG